jgi:hypothetical protein
LPMKVELIRNVRTIYTRISAFLKIKPHILPGVALNQTWAAGAVHQLLPRNPPPDIPRALPLSHLPQQTRGWEEEN